MPVDSKYRVDPIKYVYTELEKLDRLPIISLSSGVAHVIIATIYGIALGILLIYALICLAFQKNSVKKETEKPVHYIEVDNLDPTSPSLEGVADTTRTKESDKKTPFQEIWKRFRDDVIYQYTRGIVAMVPFLGNYMIIVYDVSKKKIQPLNRKGSPEPWAVEK